MKNLLTSCLATIMIVTSSLNADIINESKTDIYFGNGVWNKKYSDDCDKDGSADCSRKILAELIKREIIKSDPKLQSKYGEVMLQYNWGEGEMDDVLETYYQLKEAGQVNDLEFFALITLLTKGNVVLSAAATTTMMASMPFYAETEQANVDEMWQKYYNESFKKSHRVVLVSHSQGNLFANRIHDTISPTEYQSYFANLQIASPASEIKAIKGDYVTLDGDRIVGYIPHRMTPNANLDASGNIEQSNHTFIESYLGHQDSLSKIIEKLKILLPSANSELSQWITKDEIGEETKEYRITVKHRFDNAVLDIDAEIYPFDASKYLYQVPNPLNQEEKVYVKASYGGERILSDEDVNEWEAKENQFYKLEGTDPVEYIEGESCKDPSIFEVISQENKNTADWRVTVKNRETNETTEGVYPFNLQGSLYQIDSGAWVLATCGGIAIEPDWVGKTENEFYKLTGTEEVIKGKMGECNNAPYKPDHFEISWDFAIEEGNRKFVYYHSEPQEQGARLGFSISAVDQDGYMFTSIDNNCYPEDVNVTISFDTFGEKSLHSIIQPKDDNKSLAQFEPLQNSENQYSFLINTSEFVNGHIRKEYKINFERTVNRAKNPLKLTIKDVAVSFAGVISNDSDDKSVTFIYASAYVPERYIPRGYDEVNTKVYYEAYCKGFSKQDFDITGHESVDRYGWFILLGDTNLDYTNPRSSYSKVGISKYNKDYIHSVKNASAPLGTTVTYTPKGYLLYDKYRDIKTHSFKLRYQ